MEAIVGAVRRRPDARRATGFAAAATLVVLFVASEPSWVGVAAAFSWLTGILIGIRTPRAIAAFRGLPFPRHIEDRWGYGFAVGSISFVFGVYLLPIEKDVALRLFAVGTCILYGLGKLGCAECGCCRVNGSAPTGKISLPAVEAAVCATAIGIAAGFGPVEQACICFGSYAVTRFTSVVLRRKRVDIADVAECSTALAVIFLFTRALF